MVLEMGINNLGIDLEDYEKRVRYALKRIAGDNPEKPVIAIDVFYCDDDLRNGGHAECFRAILRRVVSELGLPNLHYINGLNILPNARRAQRRPRPPVAEGSRDYSLKPHRDHEIRDMKRQPRKRLFSLFNDTFDEFGKYRFTDV